MQEHIKLNNEIMTYKDGKLQFDKDKEAVQAYFINYVNQNTVYFHDLREKINYLLDNDYYEKELFDKYKFKDIKKVFTTAYSYKFRFSSFMSAFKFYNDYALKTNDKKKILERYEDRMAVISLFFANGDPEKALEYVHLLMKQEYTPATPTILNAGRSRRGELISCFLLEVGDSLNDINMAVGTSMQLSKMGGGVSTNLSNIRAKGESIKDVDNATKGVVGVMKLLDNAFRYADQMSQRAGSGSSWLNVFHADIHDFLDTKKISGDDDIRIKTLSIGVILQDKFIELAKNDEPMYVFYPHTVYKEYGKYLDDIDMNVMYDELVKNPNIRKDKIDARKLLEKFSVIRSESGYPYIMFRDNANKSHALNNINPVKFSNLCVTGDTELLTSEGYIPAKELYEKGNDLTVAIDDRTKELNPSAFGTSEVSAIPMQLTAKEADVYEIKTKEGFIIKSTEWHKYYVETKGRLLKDASIEKKPLSEISEGDRILVQSGEGLFGKYDDPDLAYLTGIIVGDGTFTQGSARVALYDNKKSLADDIESKVKKVINTYSEELVPSTTLKYSLEPKFSRIEESNKWCLQSKALGNILKSLNMEKNNKLSVPDFVKRGTKDTVTSFLSGLFKMDGTVNLNIKSKALTIELTSISETLLKDTQKILLNLGIYSTIYKRHDDKKNMLPDGRGGNKEYDVKASWKLSVQDRKSRDIFFSIIRMKDEDHDKHDTINSMLAPVSRTAKHHFTGTIESITYIGKEDVYDTRQDDYSSLIFNGIVTGNCSEILQASELSTYTDYGEEDKIGMDISCNLGSLNINNIMNNKSLESSVKTSIDALTRVSVSSNIKNAPAVRKANENMRSVGLGAMNLHGFLAQKQIPYESEIARDFANVFFATVNYWTLVRSNEIAKETGEVFYKFDGTDYANGKYFTKYLENGYAPTTERVQELFEGMYIPSKQDWETLKGNVMEHGLFHSYRQAIAPTGSVSYINNCSASVMPIMERIEERTYGNSKTYYPMPGISPQNWFFYKEAYDMDMFKVVDMIATIQQHVDQGISFTLFLKDTMTTRDVNKIDLYAHHKGIKTLYYARTKDTTLDDCLSCQV